MFSAARHTALRQARSSCLQRSRVTAPLSRDAALARLLSTLAVLEQREGKLNMSSLAAVSAAMKLGGQVTGFVAGSNTKAVAEDAAKVEGLDKVIYVDNADYDKVCKLPSLAFSTNIH
jgi:electron transfer flavoprotein alpha subunit